MERECTGTAGAVGPEPAVESTSGKEPPTGSSTKSVGAVVQLVVVLVGSKVLVLLSIPLLSSYLVSIVLSLKSLCFLLSCLVSYLLKKDRFILGIFWERTPASHRLSFSHSID